MTKQGRELFSQIEPDARPAETMNADEMQWNEMDRLDDADVRLDPAIQAHLGKILRAAYQEHLAKPVPERFLKLLDELDRRERGR